MTRRILGSAVLGVLMAATTPASAQITTCAPDSGNRAIAESYNARWLSAVNAGDPHRIADLYAESAVLMPPTDETFVGREPITEFLGTAAVPARESAYSVDLVACEIRGNSLHIAAVWGSGTGAPERSTGNLLRILEPADNGHWVSRYEIWN